MMGIRSQLIKQKEKVVHQAAEKLLQNDTKGAEDSESLLNLYNGLISALPREKNRDFWAPIIVAIICINLAALAWTVRIWETDIVLTAETDAVTFHLANQWKWNENPTADPNSFALYQLSTLDLPPGSETESLTGSPWIQIKGGNIALDRFEVPEGNKIRIEMDKELHQYSVSAPQFKGELQLWGEVKITSGPVSGDSLVGTVDTLNIDIPESIWFMANNSAVPALMQFRPKEELALHNVEIQRTLSFSRNISSELGEEKFVCAMSKGKVVLSDISQSVELEEEECVTLNDPIGRISHIRFDDNTIAVKFEGKVSSIHLSSNTNITPTILEFLYYNQRLALIWSAGIFLWGGLWSFRKMLFP